MRSRPGPDKLRGPRRRSRLGGCLGLDLESQTRRGGDAEQLVEREPIDLPIQQVAEPWRRETQLLRSLVMRQVPGAHLLSNERHDIEPGLELRRLDLCVAKDVRQTAKKLKAVDIHRSAHSSFR
jgi:hypothetical protein